MKYNINQKELSLRIGLTKKAINEIIQGKNPVTRKTSEKLEKVFPISASFWDNIQEKYDLKIKKVFLKKITHREIKENEKEIKKVYTNLTENNLIPTLKFTKTNYQEIVLNIHRYFGIDSFKLAFPKHKKVNLKIKCINSDFDKNNFIKLKKGSSSDSRIKIIDSYLSREKLDNLFLQSDCYISLHRSEGFGLTLAEAMALGKPVIATNYSANTDFMNETNSFPVSYDLIRLRKSYGPYRKGNHWANPSIKDAANKMRYVFENQEIAKQKGLTAKKYLKDNFSPAVIKKIIEKRLIKIKSKINN
jgi:addiction module HigA family antidote